MSSEPNNKPNHVAMKNRGLETAITAALEQAPQPAIPVDFAARVAARTVLLPKPRASRAGYGRRIAFVAAAVLAATLFVLAPATAHNVSSVGFVVEMIVLAELCGLMYWLTRPQRELF